MAPDDSGALPPSVRAFGALASTFDATFATWKSVAAQRRAVRRELLRAFPESASLLELGGGTGEDALFLAERKRRVVLTDGSPEMVAQAQSKVESAGLCGVVRCEALALEELENFASRRRIAGEKLFDGCYSNFASLNCVTDLAGIGRGLSRLIAPGGRALLVVFGPCSPGEMLVLAFKGRYRSIFRRLSRGPASARVGGHLFTVSYPAPATYARAFFPWFKLQKSRGIGLFVPPSSAEPFVSRFPRLLSFLETLDRAASIPLAFFGDHILLDFVRTGVDAD